MPQCEEKGAHCPSYFMFIRFSQLFFCFWLRTVEVIDGPKFTPKAQKKKAQKSRKRKIWITWVTLTFQRRKQKETNDFDAMISDFSVGFLWVQLLNLTKNL